MLQIQGSWKRLQIWFSWFKAEVSKRAFVRMMFDAEDSDHCMARGVHANEDIGI